jgi:hypothetical protein
MGRGEARASQVPGPSSSSVPWSNTPPDTPLASPTARRGRCCLHGMQHPGPPGSVEVSGPPAPWPTRAPADASPRPLLVPAPGGLPARAGSPLAGRDSHPLDDRRSVMKVSSLHSPATSIAWSHSISYPLSYTLYGTALERCPDSSVAGMEIANHAIPHPAWTAPRALRPQRPKGSRVLREGEQMRRMTPLVRGGSPVFVRCRRIGDAQHEGVLGGIS